jgi:nucleotide-binding universal stress UspA family protein
MFQNVVVGVGGHESWRDAIALAKQLCCDDGRLTLANIFVFDAEPHLSSGYSRDVEALERARAAGLLQRARAFAGIPAAARWRGAASVGRGLHELAATLDADVLVVGVSREGAPGRTLFGDNTGGALNGAPCAVAVAPAGYEQRAGAIRRVRVLRGRSADEPAPGGGSVDLLVAGSHGFGPVGRLRDRSRYRMLMRSSRRPLLVLPRGMDPLAAAEALTFGERPVRAQLG